MNLTLILKPFIFTSVSTNIRFLFIYYKVINLVDLHGGQVTDPPKPSASSSLSGAPHMEWHGLRHTLHECDVLSGPDTKHLSPAAH